jgi:amidase
VTERLSLEVALDRIARRADLNAFICVGNENGRGPVIAVKDLIDVCGMITTNGGPDHGLKPATADAHSIALLRSAGVVVIGKTNLFEWGFGVSSVNRNHGNVLNPHDPRRSAGGSSSGSAVAVAEGMCDWAIGTDTAGSVRIPAALCGVVGFKPSYGLISMTGVTPLSPSQDTLGVLATSVEVAAQATSLMSERDLVSGVTSWSQYAAPRVAIPKDWLDDLDADVLAAWAPLATLPEIDFPERQALFEVGTIIQSYEAARIHGAMLGASPDKFSPVVFERLMAGFDISEKTYDEARLKLQSLAVEMDRALISWDAVVTPTTAIVAPALEDQEAREPLTRFTRPFSASGHPAISIPVPSRGLPVGIQVIGRRGFDAELLRVAHALEHEFGTHLEDGEAASR